LGALWCLPLFGFFCLMRCSPHDGQQ